VAWVEINVFSSFLTLYYVTIITSLLELLRTLKRELEKLKGAFGVSIEC